MKFIVDEMPFDYYDCPFCKEDWSAKWIYTCSLSDWDCDLHEKEGECYGLKRIKGAANENDEGVL